MNKDKKNDDAHNLPKEIDMPLLNEAIVRLSELFVDTKQLIPDTSFLIRPMKPLMNTNNILEDSLKTYSESLQNIEHVHRIKTSFSPNLNPILNISFRWNEIVDSLSKTFGFTREEEFKQFEYNWVRILSAPKLRTLYYAFKNGDEESIKQYFYEWFSDENMIEKLIQDLGDNEIFVPRMHIISKALKAHLNSDYELSIPIMLAQIDGIFIEKYKELDGKITYSKKCPECGTKIKREEPLNARNISQHILQKEDTPYFHKHIINMFANLRNDILHGKNLNYPNKDISTKLIVTLLELNYRA